MLQLLQGVAVSAFRGQLLCMCETKEICSLSLFLCFLCVLIWHFKKRTRRENEDNESREDLERRGRKTVFLPTKFVVSMKD